LHVKRSLDKGRDSFDSNLPSDIESSTCATLDEVSRVVGFSGIDREDLIVSHIHVGTKEVEEHVPSANEPCLVDAGKEASQVLVNENEVSINRNCLQDGEEHLLTQSGLGAPE
jgi:hypothetical protein